MEEERRKKGRGIIPLLILVIIIGLLVFALVQGRDVISPYIKKLKPMKTHEVSGIVVSKMNKGSSLLMTVDTPDGAMLATFTRKIDEVDLLVSEGDTIEFSISGYSPFITDPNIYRVRKKGSVSGSSATKAGPVKENDDGPSQAPDVKKPEPKKGPHEQPAKPAPETKASEKDLI
ncbi:MAG: hypothetical protein JSV21_07465 [Nitrospirota bacterium]|nr:MAG: hypothetical protein JSV21_07465 [Nitrospirota bacterium]